MTNTHNWQIGDDIIMTADSGKGAVAYTNRNGFVENGEHKGVVVALNVDTSIETRIKGLDLTWDFNSDGSCSAHPGMSIRPAEISAKIKVKKFIPRIDISDCSEPIEPTPSQWIEGKPKEPGNYWLLWSDGKSNAFSIKEGISGNFFHLITAHCPISELPPPPPAKEVEAFGILERIKQINFNLSNSDKELGLAIAFYSQPATAEVLNKYLKPKDIADRWVCDYPRLTLDQFISWCVADRDIPLFTPAALKELGVK